jgi:uncharacterized protein
MRGSGIHRPEAFVIPSRGASNARLLPVPHPFIESILKRRTQYALGRNLRLPRFEVVQLIEDAVRHSPSSYNSQSSRAVILFDAHSEKFWGFVHEVLSARTAPDAFTRTANRLRSFQAAAGTILFFEDQETLRGLQEKNPAIADKFAAFSEHSSGMAQFAVWSALANAGIGASLQHYYEPFVAAQIAATWEVPPTWRIRAQMPFGSNEAPLGTKTFIDDSVRFKVFGE